MVSLSHGGCNVTGIRVSERKRSDKAAGEGSMEPAEGRQGADEAWPRRLHRSHSGLASPPQRLPQAASGHLVTALSRPPLW